MYSPERIVSTKIKCPKCKSTELLMEEYWEGHFITWELSSGKFDRNDGVLEPGGPKSVHGKCKTCNHSWKVRRAGQIDDIVEL